MDPVERLVSDETRHRLHPWWAGLTRGLVAGLTGPAVGLAVLIAAWAGLTEAGTTLSTGRGLLALLVPIVVAWALSGDFETDHSAAEKLGAGALAGAVASVFATLTVGLPMAWLGPSMIDVVPPGAANPRFDEGFLLVLLIAICIGAFTAVLQGVRTRPDRQ